MSEWSHRFLFHSVSYTPLLSFFMWCSNCPRLLHWSWGDILPDGFLWVTGALLSFLVHFLVFPAQRTIQVFSTFCVMALESAMSPRSFSSLWCTMELRNQDLDPIAIGFLLFCDSVLHQQLILRFSRHQLVVQQFSSVLTPFICS